MAKPRVKNRQGALTSGRVGGLARAPEASTDHECPAYCFKYLQPEWGLDQCTLKEKAALASALIKRSKMQWSQLRAAPKHGLGYETVTRNAIRTTIPTSITEDVRFIAFRFCGKAPMVGYRDGATLRLLWLDRTFSLYDHS